MNTGQVNVSNGPNRPSRLPAATRSDHPHSGGLVSKNPLTAAVVVFGIGLGVGAALVCLLGRHAMQPPSLARRTGLAAEKLGQQVWSAIAGVLPDSVAKHIS